MTPLNSHPRWGATIMDLWFAASGLLGGFLVGLTGVGGGSLMTPLLIMAFHVPPPIAVGTDLLYAALTKAGGVWAYHRRGQVNWAVTRNLLLGSLPASLATLLLWPQGHDDTRTDQLICRILGFALFLTAMALLFRRRPPVGTPVSPPSFLAGATGYWTCLVGAFVGVMATLSSVGAGAVGTAALMTLFPGMALSRMVGTEIAHAVPLTLVAGIGHGWRGHVDPLLLVNLLAGSLPGIWMGARLNARLSERTARPLLVLMLLGIASQLL